MNYILTVVKPESLPTLTEICAELALPMTVTLHARGTAAQSMLDLLGIESTEKRLVLTFASPERHGSLLSCANDHYISACPATA